MYFCNISLVYLYVYFLQERNMALFVQFDSLFARCEKNKKL